MRSAFHKNFEKDYARLRESTKKKFKERHALFLEDEFHQLLNNHALAGKFLGYRNINVTGDFRAVYHKVSTDAVLFVAIDTHSNLYS